MIIRIALNLLIIFPLVAFAQRGYRYTADLQNIDNDRVVVTLLPPEMPGTEVVYCFPKVIPGSYSEKIFGDYIEDFSAKDRQGKRMKVQKLNESQYKIYKPANLASISYKVNDTWDKPSRNFIFQPGGTNIDAGNNIVMNNHAFFGYFEGYSQLPIEVEVIKPAYMFGATHLQKRHLSATKDVLLADDYFTLVDNPVFYAAPDTTSFYAGDTKIDIAVISANGKVTSKQIAAYLQPLAGALHLFFDGLPVKHYQFLFYFEDIKNIAKKENSGGFGALEHNYSSLYFLPEISFEPRMKEIVLEVASHEFLHILTPLNLHSEHIENFDFINPKMSKHLWLYEGVTEYFSQLTQVQHQLVSTDAFFEKMRQKMSEAEKYGDFSLTVMSEHVLEPLYKDKYASVYNKGALTAMMLDILIREKTAGSKDLKDVITSLTKKYGPGKPFKDDDLFKELVAASHPAVQEFIDLYIAGDKPLPYDHFLNRIGYNYNEVKRMDAFYNGKLAIKYDDEDKAFVFVDVEKQNALGIKEGDVFLSINNIAVTSTNVEELWDTYFKRNTQYPDFSVGIKREGVQKQLNGSLYKGIIQARHFIEPMDTVDHAQLSMRYAMLRNNNAID